MVAGFLFGSLIGFAAGFAEGEVGFDVFVGEGRVEWAGDFIRECGVLVDEVEAGEFALLLVGVLAGWLGDRRFGGCVGLGWSEMRGFFPCAALRLRMTIQLVVLNACLYIRECIEVRGLGSQLSALRYEA